MFLFWKIRPASSSSSHNSQLILEAYKTELCGAERDGTKLIDFSISPSIWDTDLSKMISDRSQLSDIYELKTQE